MNIGILGCGAYGLALAHIAHKNNQSIEMWTHSNENYKKLIEERKTQKLEEYIIPSDIQITKDIKKVVKNKDLIVIAVAAYGFEDTIKKLNKYIEKNTPVLIATKGIQQNTCLFLHDVFKKYCKNPYAIISGPTFAVDIIKDSAIGLTLCTKNNRIENIVRKCFENENTKFRRSKDIIGVEICASVKNVMAIASGMLEGMKVTPSTRALFLTESMNDIKELIHALGGKKKTILSYAGFGDILMTCTSKTSRNFTFGYLIGSGKSKKEIDEYLNNNTVEGMYTLKSIHKLVKKKKVKMPIINLIYDIILNSEDKKEMLNFLISK